MNDKLTAGLRSHGEFKVNRIQLPVPGHLQRHAALVARRDGGHRSPFAEGADGRWSRAQVGDQRIRVAVWTGVLIGNLSHSWFWEIQLERPVGDNFQIPGEGSVEVREQRGFGLNNVARTGCFCAVWDL